MSGYVFHCSKCSFPHAGECRPTIAQVMAEVQPICPQCVAGTPCLCAQQSISAPAKTRVVVGGSRWKVQDYDVATFSWAPRPGSPVFEVIGFLPPLIQVRSLDSGTEYDVDSDAFQANGWIQGAGHGVRMVPAP